MNKKMRSINSEKSEGRASRKDLFGYQIYKQNLHISVEGTYMYKLSNLCGLTLGFQCKRIFLYKDKLFFQVTFISMFSRRSWFHSWSWWRGKMPNE